MNKLLAVAAVLTVLALTVQAHGPPNPNDDETRLLVDHNDDCGGDSASGLSQCSGSHDLISLDVKETYDNNRGDLLVFRFIMNGGDAAAGLKDVLTFNAGSSAKSFELRTTDNKAFTTTGFETISAAQSIGDGTRFAVEATIARNAVGDVGSKISGFKINAYHGSTLGDYMPGGYQGPLGPVANPDQGSQPTNYVKPEYALRGPGYYIDLQPAGDAVAPAGGESEFTVQVTNALGKTAQTITLDLLDGPAHFHPSAGDHNGGTDTRTVDLRAGETASVIVGLSGEGSGTLMVLAQSNRGGLTMLHIPFTTTEAQQPTGNDGGSSDPGDQPSGNHDSNEKGSPAPNALLALAAVATVAMARRRLFN